MRQGSRNFAPKMGLCSILLLAVSIVAVRAWGVIGKFRLDSRARHAYVATKCYLPQPALAPCDTLEPTHFEPPPRCVWVPVEPSIPLLSVVHSFRVSRARAPPVG